MFIEWAFSDTINVGDIKTLWQLHTVYSCTSSRDTRGSQPIGMWTPIKRAIRDGRQGWWWTLIIIIIISKWMTTEEFPKRLWLPFLRANLNKIIGKSIFDPEMNKRHQRLILKSIWLNWSSSPPPPNRFIVNIGISGELKVLWVDF